MELNLTDTIEHRIPDVATVNLRDLTVIQGRVRVELPRRYWQIFYELLRLQNQPVSIDALSECVFGQMIRQRPDAQIHNTIKMLNDRLKPILGLHIEMRNLNSKKRRTEYVLRVNRPVLRVGHPM